MKKTYHKWFFTKVKKAVRDYQMIENGDRVTVGVSGGKDSSSLLYILWLLKEHSGIKFDLQAITLDLGFGVDLSPIENFCRDHNIPLHLEPTQIGEIVFDIRQETNPCSLCAKLRRGALHETALRFQCNKVALGHHLDDAIETLLMNIIYTGRMGTFPPSAFLSRTGLTLIRPLVYIPQETIVSLVKLENLPVVENPCPANGHTKRQEMKELVSMLQLRYPNLKEKFLTSLQNVDLENMWKQRQMRE